MTDRSDVQVGDELTLVVTQTNADSDRDPVTQIDGTTTFIRYPEDKDPEFGECVRARIADVGDSHYVAVLIERDD